MNKTKILLFFLLLSSTLLLAQTIIHVSPTGNGNGSTWAQASNLPNAIAQAPAGTTLRVQQGTYPISSTLIINKRLEIFGGFSGTGIQRDPALYPSIIDGQNEVHMIHINSQNTVLDGISFINGYADIGTDVNDIKGGALYIAGNGTQINNCIFKDNTSENRIGSGAIYIWNVDNVVIKNSFFENNRVMENSLWSNSPMGGGAIHDRFGNNNLIENCIFKNNTAHYSGGAIYIWSTNSRITGCTFENNHSKDNGGAIVNRSSTENNSWIENCIFKDNTANQSGGAIYSWGENTKITGCVFEMNYSEEDGGAVFINGHQTSIINSLFHNNKAALLGGAVYNRSELYVANSTFVSNGNTAIVHTFREPDLFSAHKTHIFNSIFFNNDPGNIMGTTLFPDVDKNSLLVDKSERDFRGNLFEENPYGSDNLIGEDPYFVNNNNDFNLLNHSPAIEFGKNALYTQNSGNTPQTEEDLSGNPRLFGTHIDAGAYELQLVPVPTNPKCTSVTNINHGDTDVSVNTAIQWNTVGNAIGYHISIGTAQGGTDIADRISVTGTSYAPTTDLPRNTMIYISVIPYNTVGSATGCNGISFTTEQATPPPTAPDCTVITSPVNGTTNVDVATLIQWTAVDNATGYYVSIGTTQGGTEIADRISVTDTSYTPTADLPQNTTVYVSVIPYNAVGSATGCNGISFTTEEATPPPTAPDCTVITSPDNGTTNADVATPIQWNAVQNATGYYVNIGTILGGTDIADRISVTGTSYNPTTDLPQNTTVYVSVIPYNAVGSATGCNGISFTTEEATPPPTAPDCTVITSPDNGTTNVNVTTLIQWTAVDNATGYYVNIGTILGGTDIADRISVTGTSYNPTTDLPENTTVYVSVIPYNAVGSATDCNGISFTTEEATPPPTAPDCTTITSPVNGATDVNVATPIQWTAVDNATGYYVSIGTEQGGTDITNQIPVTSTSYTPTADLPQNTMIYISVIPYNTVGSTTGCKGISFTTEQATPPPTAPDCTIITSPVNGATEIDLATSIQWNAIQNATGYHISIGTTQGGTEIADQIPVTGTSYTPTADLPQNTMIYISVIPYNTVGSATGCNGISFTTEVIKLTDETKYGFSPNGDGINDFWIIHGIDNYPENIVSIYNRWGDMVFQISGYDNRTNVFDGTANRLTQLGAGRLPSGTYFFQIKNVPEHHHFKKLKGYLILKR